MHCVSSSAPAARRRLFGVIARGLALTVLLLGAARPAAAAVREAPVLQQRAAITSPAPQARVRGVVSISGSAMHPEFERYELYYTIEPGENWVFIGEAKYQQVESGPLGTWDTTSLPDGTYSLRLRVVRRDGNYDEAYARNIVVANQAPPEPTPTPTLAALPTLPPPVAAPGATPTPEPTPTPATVELPEIATPTPRPSPSPTPTASGAVANSPGSGSDGGPLAALNPLSLREAAITGAAYAGGAFLAVGVFFGVRRLLTWLWYLIAP
ncbi:MAG: hypothetical protein RMN53_11720 [Anaerolineae bacterium]|nr:hypothetical protein [Anaerolineae bacterium]